MRARADAARTLHRPVLLSEVVAALAPRRGGVYLDGTFGAGGYARAVLEAGAERVIGVDRDPEAVARAAEWAALYQERLTLAEGRFGELDAIAAEAGAEGTLAGVTLDIGVSSMQIDAAERGFSFQKDGPLDMRMEGAGRSAADLIAEASEATLADILFHYGEERAARRIARAIVAARADAPVETTRALAEICERCLPRPKPGQPHPATRAFQALRIAVNDELGELARGLAAAERALAEDGVLAVVTFHSLEDRIVKRFLQGRMGRSARGSRHQPLVNQAEPSFAATRLDEAPGTKRAGAAIAPSEAEIAANPRARSAKLRWAVRTAAPAHPAADPAALGAPSWKPTSRSKRR